MSEFVQTLLISCIPAIITGLVTYLVAHNKTKSQIKILKKENEHDLKKLMEQHKVDIDSLKEEYRLKMEMSEKEHQHKIELLQTEHNNEIIRKEKEAENDATYGMMKDVVGGLFGGLMNSAMSAPEVQKQIGDTISIALKESQ